MRIGSVPTFGINQPACGVNHFDIHVFTSGGLWNTKRDSSPYSSGTFVTQQEAIGSGMRQAREAQAHLVVRGRDGNVRFVRDYTNWVDPFR